MSEPNHRGRVEKIAIDRICDSGSGTTAHLNDSLFYISSAERFVGQEILAKIDLNDRNGRYVNGRKKLARANFITSQIPEGFTTGLAPEQYVLIGLWEERMQQNRRYPTLNEINKFYDPGQIPFVLFQQEEGDEDQSFVGINPKGLYWLYGDARRVIDQYLPFPDRSTRLILAETPEDIQEIKIILGHKRLTPIELEPLR